MKFTIKDFRKRFPNDDACLDELMHKRFGDVAHCPDCKKETNFYRVKKRKCYQCQWCGYQISPTAGTIFHKSRTPLTDWFYVMYLMTATRSGVSAKEIERQLGVTYKCAWRMCHQVRQAMNERPIKLKGDVELDETYMGGKKKGTRGRGAKGKTPVFGAVEREGKLDASVVEDCKAKTLMPIVQETVEVGSNVMTDEFRSYGKLARFGYNHEHVCHSAKEYVRGIVHTNSLEGFWSQLKRGISGTHIWVSQKHLQRYINEFAFRYNQRAGDAPMFDRLFLNLVRLSPAERRSLLCDVG